MYALCRAARAFDPSFAKDHVDAAFVDGMSTITPLNALGMLADLKLQMPQYLAAAANAPAFNKGSVADYSDAILGWWRDNSSTFPAWALAARIVFAVSPNSAFCERVFALLKNLFGEEQMSAPCRLRASFADTELQRPRGGLRYVLAAAACTCQGFVIGSHMPEVGGV